MAALATAFVRLRLDTRKAKDDLDDTFNGREGERPARAKGERLGASMSKGLGAKLNDSLKKLDLPEINLKGNAKEAINSIRLTQDWLKDLAKSSPTIEARVEINKALTDITRLRKQVDDEMRSAGRSASRSFASGFEEGGSVFARVAATMAARATILVSGLAAAAPAAAQFVAAIAPATGIVAGLVPVTLAATAVMQTFKMATDGMANAISKGLGPGGDAYEKALAQLVPAQRAVVEQVVDMQERFDSLSQTVAQNFFSPLTSEIDGLANTYFPLLEANMGSLGGKMGLLFREISQGLQSQAAVQLVNDTFAETGFAIDSAKFRVQPLIEALARLGSSTIPILRTITGDTNRVVDGLTRWANQAAESGKLVTMFDKARLTIGQVYQILANLGAISKAVFGALLGDGEAFLAKLIRITGQVREFVESAKGGQTLANLFQTLGVLGEAMRRALAGVLPEVGESLEIAGPAAAEFAQAAANLLISLGPLLPALTGISVQILTAFIPAINALAGFLADNQGLLQALAPLLIGYAVYQKGAAAATAIHTAAMKLNTLAVNFSKTSLATWIGVKALELGAWIRSTAATVASTAAIAANRIAMVAHSAAMGVARVAMLAWSAATTVASVAMRAAGVALRFMTGPIGIAITAITLLIGITIKLYKENETFRKIVDSVWRAIKSAIKSVGDWFVNTLWPSLKTAWRQLGDVMKALGDTAKNVWKFIKDQIEMRVNMIKAVFAILKTLITVTIPDAFRAGRDAMRNAIESAKNAIRDRIDAVKNTLNSLKTFITVTLPNAFKSGVAAIGKAWDKVKDAAKKPVTFVANSVINPLIRGYNKIAGVFGADKADEISGFARGGRIPGVASSTDNTLATVMGAGRQALGNIKVATGEFITNARSTSENLPWLKWANAGGRFTDLFTGKKVNGVNPMTDGREGGHDHGYADGGLIGSFLDKVSRGVKGVGDFVTDPAAGLKKAFDSMIGKIPGGGSIVNLVKGMANKAYQGVKEFLSGGMFSGGSGGSFGKWPSSPSAQRGDSGVWRRIVAMIKGSGIRQGAFGNGYRPGDPKWHGSGRAVDWMGFNMDALATWLARLKPLELIHRTRSRDYAYTRGKNKGSFNESLMNAHKNHIHIAMRKGGRVADAINGSLGRMAPVELFDKGGAWPSGTFGYNGSGRTEYVDPNFGSRRGGGGNTYNITVNVGPTAHPAEVGRATVEAIKAFERGSGKAWRTEP